MSMFVVLAVLFVAGSLAFLLIPLLRTRRGGAPSPLAANVSVYQDKFAELERDLRSGILKDDQYAQARAELERRLLDDAQANPEAPDKSAVRSGRWTAVGVALAVPIAATLLYLHLGNPGALNAPKHATIDPANVTQEQFQQMTDKLAVKMQSRPDDPIGWTMLGRAYKALDRNSEAAAAFERAVKLKPGDPDIVVDYAEALALAAGGKLEGEPTQLLERALKLSPDNEKALALAGTAAFSRNDFAGATRYWERVAAKVPADSEMGKAIASGIAEAKARASGKRPSDTVAKAGGSTATGKSTPTETTAAPTGKSVSGTVRLAPALAAKAAPEDVVYLFARAAEGPRMPLAVIKKQVKDLPFKFTLDDSMAMQAGMELSTQPRVIVSARVSKSGSATPAAGDLVGVTNAVSPGATGVSVIIDNQVP